jgi:hypothetical protein
MITTPYLKRRGFVIQCNTCDNKTREINSDNEVVAQRVACDYLHWKVYRNDKGEWLRACPDCVKRHVDGRK